LFIDWHIKRMWMFYLIDMQSHAWNRTFKMKKWKYCVQSHLWNSTNSSLDNTHARGKILDILYVLTHSQLQSYLNQCNGTFFKPNCVRLNLGRSRRPKRFVVSNFCLWSSSYKQRSLEWSSFHS
jgi:hypothetical protein